tara:strand:- start:102 stop:626 length:525 start_codon:yes stop_codon:yes gene_type:complete
MALIENVFLFPQNLYKIDCKSEFDYLLKESYVIKKKYKNDYPIPELMYASKNRNIFENESSFFPLKNLIKEILYNIHPKINKTITHSWINFGYKYNFQEYHTHPDSNMAGVYYIKCPPNSGEILIYNKNKYNDIYPITPYEGLMILFDGSQPHSVLQNFSNDPRISLPFNIKFE